MKKNRGLQSLDPIRSTKFLQNPDPIQSNPWMDPIHVQLWSTQVSCTLADAAQVAFAPAAPLTPYRL